MRKDKISKRSFRRDGVSVTVFLEVVAVVGGGCMFLERG